MRTSTRSTFATVATLSALGCLGDDCQIDIDPINGANMLQIEECLAAAGVDDLRVASLFDQALTNRRDDLAAYLLRHGVKPNSLPALVNFAATQEMPQVLETLLDRDESLVNGGPDRLSPLASAAIGGSYRAARLLVSKGADPNTGLLAAVQQDHLHIAHMLIERGAAVEVLPGPAAAELLGSAARATNYQFVDYLLQRGLDPNLRDEMGTHVLEFAQIHRDERMGWSNWRTLIQYGADAHTVACGFGTARMEALQSAPDWYRSAIERHRELCDKPAVETSSGEQ